MATQAPTQTLPLLYNSIEPLSSQVHGKMSIRPPSRWEQLSKVHAVPVTIEEFPLTGRHFPIIFSSGDVPVPLALMGLTEGVNAFVNEDGRLLEDRMYLPAYVRRYPFLLARLTAESEELSLCFDPTLGSIGEFDEGERLFDVGGQPSDATKAILQFCEQFETAAQRTNAFMEELKSSGLLMDGEVAIQPEGAEQPFIFRGFRMVDEEKLRELRGDELRKMNQNGMLSLIFAHLFSLSQIRDVFQRQVEQGKGPVQPAQVAAPSA